MSTVQHIGLSLGRIQHWHDGLGEFSRQLVRELAAQAPRLREQFGWELHLHLPRRWHGEFGDDVRYLDTHTAQRWLHLRNIKFSLWHTLHQHNRLKAPLGTLRRIETVHDLNYLHLKQGAKVERYRQRQRRRLARYDTIVAITQFVAADLARELNPLPTPLQVIYNGATDLTCAPQTVVAGLGASPFLLHISRMAPSKNIVALLDLAASWPEQQIVLAGASSAYSTAVKHMVAQRALTNVTVKLDLSEAHKAWLFANCLGFLFPSIAEGFGLPPIEAMHFGKPVFLSKLTSLPEIGGTAAYYFENFVGSEMRMIIEAALATAATPERREKIAEHARRFSWQRCAQAYIALYKNLLGS